MSEKVIIRKINEVYIRVIAEPSTIMEMSEYFTFDIPGAKYSPAFKNRVWDGKIRLLNKMTGYIYAGLNKEIEKFCEVREYEVVYEYDNSAVDFSLLEAKEFIKSLNLPFEPRDYQISSFVKAIRYSRKLFISPVNSGKSLFIYLITRYYNAKTLIIVPTISLVNQMTSDFGDYNYDTSNIHKISAGEEKYSEKKIIISTWQSIYKMNKDYFNQFDVIIGDEADTFKAKSLIDIMCKADKVKYRFGTTGTVDGSETNLLTLQGLFGPVVNVTTTKELQKRGISAELAIKIIVLSYPEAVRQNNSKNDYQSEVDYIVTLPERNNFITKLALSLEGNTMLLFQFVEKHGKVMYQQLKKSNKKVFYVSGETPADEREEIRKQVANETDCIIIASFGTFSRGTNIKNIHNLIFSSPSKARVRNLQAIGRALRVHESKDIATLYDIGDDLSWKSKKNFTILHMMERIKIYSEEGFDYKLYNVRIKTS